MAKTISIKVDEEEKKIIDLIRKMKIDFQATKLLIYYGINDRINRIEEAAKYKQDEVILDMMQRDLDKYTKLLEYLEKGE